MSDYGRIMAQVHEHLLIAAVTRRLMWRQRQRLWHPQQDELLAHAEYHLARARSLRIGLFRGKGAPNEMAHP